MFCFAINSIHKCLFWELLDEVLDFADCQIKAEQGNAQAQFNLGMMYYKGEGVPQDKVMAHMYINIAAAKGGKEAVHNRDIISKNMSLSQIEKAQDLAREWVKTHK